MSAVYFFEDLPVAIMAERWKRAHPGLGCYYQPGVMHAILGNIFADLSFINQSMPSISTTSFKFGKVSGVIGRSRTKILLSHSDLAFITYCLVHRYRMNKGGVLFTTRSRARKPLAFSCQFPKFSSLSS
jgi:hypothetical protein